MDPFELAAYIALSGGTAVTFLVAAVRERNRQRARKLLGKVIGIGIFDASGARHAIEASFINLLRDYGATCVLAGRRAIHKEIEAADVMDAIGMAQPQFGIIGTVTEHQDDYSVTWWQTTPEFKSWFLHRMRQTKPRLTRLP